MSFKKLFQLLLKECVKGQKQEKPAIIKKRVVPPRIESSSEQRKINEHVGDSEKGKVYFALKNNFSDYSPIQFESFVAKLFEKMGYSTGLTPATGDFGADILARKGTNSVLIQCKKYSPGNNVTPEDVQRTLGALFKHKCDKAVLVTTSDFTVRAKEVEKGAPIELWNKRILYMRW